MKKLNKTLFTISSLLIFSCSSNELEVEFLLNRSPIKGFSELKSIGVTNINGLTKASTRYVVSNIKKCKQFTKTKHLEINLKKIPASRGKKLTKAMDSAVNKFREARLVHGILYLDILKNTGSITKKSQKLVQIRNKDSFGWYSPYGVWNNQNYGFDSQSTIGQNADYLVRDVGTSTKRYEVSLRYILYNRVLKEVVIEDTITARGSVKTYSKLSEETGRNLRQTMTQMLLERVVSHVCPQIGAVSRKLYARGTDDKADNMIQEGIRLASDERWDPAATKWRNAILENPNNALAHHNLGIYYERQGLITSAAEHYKKATTSNHWKIIEKNLFNETLENFVPQPRFKELQPRITSLSGNQWAIVHGGSIKKLKIAKNYPIFKATRTASQKDSKILGINLVEVGRVKMIKKTSDGALFKIDEFLQSEKIEIGNVLLLK